MVAYEISENTLQVGDSTVEFINPVAEVVERGELLVVRLKLTGEVPQEMQRNIIAVDPTGAERWRIQRNPGFEHHSPYSGIWIDEGDLWAYHPTGREFKIDPETGKILDENPRR